VNQILHLCRYALAMASSQTGFRASAARVVRLICLLFWVGWDRSGTSFSGRAMRAGPSNWGPDPRAATYPENWMGVFPAWYLALGAR